MSMTDYSAIVAQPRSSTDETHTQLMIDLLSYIQQHIGETEFGTASLLRAFSLSRASLYRLFQSRGGVASYLREQRLCAAYRYLQAYPQCSLTWLLYETGFASERQFQRCFQQRFGMPPMHWRRHCRAALQTQVPRRAHSVPMERFMRELGQDAQRDHAPVRLGTLPVNLAPLVPTEALRRLGHPPRAQRGGLECAER